MSTGPDWGIGAYEEFAPTLEGAAAHLVQVAAPRKGERAVDLGCGTGNATIPLLEAGAQVTAVDPSLRLVGLATERARAAAHHLTTAVAGAESIPLPDRDADLVVSNFGLIFASDPVAALAEVLRILTPDGRLVFTAWQPSGPIAEIARLMRAAAGAAQQTDDGGEASRSGDSPGGTPGSAARIPMRDAGLIAWHDPATFAHLVPGGAEAITVHEAETDFVADSAEAWLDQQARSHPMWLAIRAHLADDAVWQRIQDDSLRILREGSKAEDRLVVASPYVVAEIHPRGEPAR